MTGDHLPGDGPAAAPLKAGLAEATIEALIAAGWTPPREDPMAGERRCPGCGMARVMTLEPAGAGLVPGCGFIRKWQCPFCVVTDRYGP